MMRKGSRNFLFNSYLSIVGPVFAILVLSVAFAIPMEAAGGNRQSSKGVGVSAQRPQDSQLAKPLFAKAAIYDSGGNGAMALVVADVNGDRYPDLVVANQCVDSNCAAGSVSVLLGNGDGTFAAPVSYGTGGGAYPFAIGDLNGDGALDIAVASSSNTLAVLLGNGDGTFQNAISNSSGGYGTSSVAIGDLNGDGYPDVVVGNSDEEVVVMLGNGDGTLRTPVIYTSAGKEVAIGDVNGDGHADLVVGRFYSSVNVLLGDGDGSFQPPVSYATGGFEPNCVALGDMNGDGKADVIVSLAWYQGDTGAVSVLLGNGDGTFRSPVAYPEGRFARSAAIGDLNGDGHPDLVAGLERRVGVLLGNGDGSFHAAGTLSAGVGDAGPAEIADVNGDGRPDLLIADFFISWSNRSGAVSVLLNLTQVGSVTKLATSGSPSRVHQSVVLTATITSKVLIPDGIAVTFYDGSDQIGSGITKNGVATVTTSSLTPKTHTIKALYPGSAFSKASSGTVKQVVEKYSTSTSLSSNLNPSGSGQTVTFTAAVSSGGLNQPTGTVKFLDGTKSLGTVTLNGGVAELATAKLRVGTHPITAEYLGDADNAKSTSPVLDQVVQ